jgi:hypothetical protein
MKTLKGMKPRRWLSAGVDALALVSIVSLLSVCAGDTCHFDGARARPARAGRRSGNYMAKAA